MCIQCGERGAWDTKHSRDNSLKLASPGSLICLGARTQVPRPARQIPSHSEPSHWVLITIIKSKLKVIFHADFSSTGTVLMTAMHTQAHHPSVQMSAFDRLTRVYRPLLLSKQKKKTPKSRHQFIVCYQFQGLILKPGM